jgi:hypothetical protein
MLHPLTTTGLVPMLLLLILNIRITTGIKQLQVGYNFKYFILCPLKGQLISKGLVGILNFSKKWTKKFDLNHDDTSGRFFLVFWKNWHQKVISKSTELGNEIYPILPILMIVSRSKIKWYKFQKVKKYALSSQLKTFQFLKNDVQVLILCLSCFTMYYSTI